MKNQSYAYLVGESVCKIDLNRLNTDLYRCSDSKVLQFKTLEGRDHNGQAYLNVEFLLKGHEFTPYMVTTPLKGSTHRRTVNKNFSKLPFEVQQVITQFCRELANYELVS